MPHGSSRHHHAATSGTGNSGSEVSPAMLELQQTVETTLMNLMSAIRSGRQDAVAAITSQWLHLYHMVYKVTTEEDVPYDMYLVMVQNVVQVLVVHVLSHVLKEGEVRGLLPGTLHHHHHPTARSECGGGVGSVGHDGKGPKPRSATSSQSPFAGARHHHANKKKGTLSAGGVAASSAKHEETAALQRGESEMEVLVLPPSSVSRPPVVPVRPPLGAAAEPTRSTSTNTTTTTTTMLVRWNNEYKNFEVFSKYTASVFRYLNQYVTQECGLEDVELMCNKLFYAVVFEPTRALQLTELRQEMHLVLEDMVRSVVAIVKPVTAVAAVVNSGSLRGSNVSLPLACQQQGEEDEGSVEQADEPRSPGLVPATQTYRNPVDVPAAAAAGRGSTSTSLSPSPVAVITEDVDGPSDLSEASRAARATQEPPPRISVNHHEARGGGVHPQQHVGPMVLINSPLISPWAAERTRAEQTWRKARDLLRSLLRHPRCVAIQRVLHSWSIFLEKVSRSSPSVARKRERLQQSATGASSASLPSPDGSPLPDDRSTQVQLAPPAGAVGGSASARPAGTAASAAIAVDLQELERIQAFLALPPATRRHSPLPAVSQDAYSATTKQLVETVCAMLRSLQPLVEEGLYQLSCGAGVAAATASFSRASPVQSFAAEYAFFSSYGQSAGQSGSDGNPVEENWSHVLLRTMLWETAIRLLGPLWANPTVARTLRMVLSPPLESTVHMISNTCFSFHVLVRKWLDIRRRSRQKKQQQQVQGGGGSPSSTVSVPAEDEEVLTVLRDLEDCLHTMSCMMERPTNPVPAPIAVVTQSGGGPESPPSPPPPMTAGAGSASPTTTSVSQHASDSAQHNEMLKQATSVLADMIAKDVAELVFSYTAGGGGGAGNESAKRGLQLIEELNSTYTLYKLLVHRCLGRRAVMQSALDQAIKEALQSPRRPAAAHCGGGGGGESRGTGVEPHNKASVSPPTSLMRRAISRRLTSILTEDETTAGGGGEGDSPAAFSQGGGSAPQGAVSFTEDSGRGGLRDSCSKSPDPVFSSGSIQQQQQQQQQQHNAVVGGVGGGRPLDMAKLLMEFFCHYAMLEETALAQEKGRPSKGSPDAPAPAAVSTNVSAAVCRQLYSSVGHWIQLLQISETFAKHFKKRMMSRLLAPQTPLCLVVCATSGSAYHTQVTRALDAARREVKRLLEKMVQVRIPVPPSTILTWATLLYHMQPAEMQEPLCRALPRPVSGGHAVVHAGRGGTTATTTGSGSNGPATPVSPGPSALPMLRVRLFNRRHWQLPQLLPHGAGFSSSTVVDTTTLSSGGGTGGSVCSTIKMPLPVQSAMNRMVGRLSQMYPLRKMEWVHFKGNVVFAGFFPCSPGSSSSSGGGGAAEKEGVPSATRSCLTMNPTSQTAQVCVCGAGADPVTSATAGGGRSPSVIIVTAHSVQGALLYLISAPAAGVPSPAATPAPSVGAAGITGRELSKRMGMSFSDLHQHLQVLLESPAPSIVTPLVVCYSSAEGAGRTPSFVPLEQGVYHLNPAFVYPHPPFSVPLKLAAIPRLGARGGRRATRSLAGSFANSSFAGGRAGGCGALSDGYISGGSAASGSSFSWSDRLQPCIMALLKKDFTAMEHGELLKALRVKFGSFLELQQVKMALERLVEVGYVKRCDKPVVAGDATSSSVYSSLPQGGGHYYTVVP